MPPGSACCYGSVAAPPAFFWVGVTVRAASMNDGLSEGEELWHLKVQHDTGVVSAYKLKKAKILELDPPPAEADPPPPPRKFEFRPIARQEPSSSTAPKR